MAKRRGKGRTGKASLPVAPVDAAPADLAQTAHSDADSKVRTADTEAQTRFLDAYTELGTVIKAAEAAGIGRRTHYDWLEADAAYAARFDAAKVTAKGIASDEFYAEARKRALDRSDKLLIEMLRAHMPETFARRLEHTGKNGAPIAHAVTVRRDLSALSDEQLAAAEDIARTLEAVKGPECPECQSHATRALPGGTCTCTTCGANWSATA